MKWKRTIDTAAPEPEEADASEKAAATDTEKPVRVTLYYRDMNLSPKLLSAVYAGPEGGFFKVVECTVPESVVLFVPADLLSHVLVTRKARKKGNEEHSRPG